MLSQQMKAEVDMKSQLSSSIKPDSREICKKCKKMLFILENVIIFHKSMFFM